MNIAVDNSAWQNAALLAAGEFPVLYFTRHVNESGHMHQTPVIVP